jgi:hypothetical protein
MYVGSEVFTAVVTFWDITPCSALSVNRRLLAGFLLKLFLDPEYGGDMFFRNAAVRACVCVCVCLRIPLSTFERLNRTL